MSMTPLILAAGGLALFKYFTKMGFSQREVVSLTISCFIPYMLPLLACSLAFGKWPIQQEMERLKGKA